MLERGFAEDVRRQQEETARIVAELSCKRFALPVGTHGRRTLVDIVRDSGFSDGGELDAILRIDGRTYR